MIPVFQILNKTLSAYMIFAAVGAIAAVLTVYALAQKHGLDEIQMLFMTLWSFIGIAVGGSLLYGITNFSLITDAIGNPGQFSGFGDVLERLQLVFGGFVFYGGLLGVLLIVKIYSKKKRLSLRYTDLAAVGITEFHFFGRLGCFLTGCCYGIESRFGFVYRHSLAPGANGVCRFPVQLIEIVYNAVMFFVLMHLFKKKKAEGYLINIYLFTYPVVRFFDEFLRGDTYRGFLLGLSTSQWISILLLLGNTFFFLRKVCKSKKALQ